MICEAMEQAHIRNFANSSTPSVQIYGHFIRIERTPCHLGGSRPWFLCPECQRRCAILYPVKCRVCLGLHYASEHESPLDRNLRAAIKFRARFGQKKGGVVPAFPRKPKWMRWHTYFKARKRAKEIENRITRAFARQMRL